MIDQVLLRRDHDHKAKTIKMKNRATKGKVPKCTSPSGTPKSAFVFQQSEGKCTKPSCNCWHPPECVKHKTNEGCQFWESVRFVSHNNEAPRKMSKKDPTSENNNIAIVRIYPKLGCASQDVKLPEQTVGPCEREKKSGKRSPESASRTQTHENFGKNHQRSGTSGTFLWKLSRVDRNIIAIPTRPLLPTEIQTTSCGQKVVPEKQLDNGPRSC